MSNIWHMTHQTPKNSLSWDVSISNTIIFTTYKQYRFKDKTVQIEKLKKYIIFYSFSLSSFMTFSLLSLSFSFFFLRHSFISVTLFSFFLLLSPKASPLCFLFFSLFFPFFLFLSLSLPLVFFLGHSLSLSSFFFA